MAGPPPQIGVAIGTIGATPEWWLESARRLEAAGYRAVWAWDHFVGGGDKTVPVVEQCLGEVRPDEPGSARDEVAAHFMPIAVGTLRPVAVSRSLTIAPAFETSSSVHAAQLGDVTGTRRAAIFSSSNAS